ISSKTWSVRSGSRSSVRSARQARAHSTRRGGGGSASRGRVGMASADMRPPAAGVGLFYAGFDPEENRMPLDPQAQAVLSQTPPMTDEVVRALTPPLLRQAMAAMPGSTGPGEPLPRVESRTLPGPAGEIPVRIYAPSEARGLPGLVYFHG